VSCSLALSLLVSLVVIPTAAARLIETHRAGLAPAARGILHDFARLLRPVFDMLSWLDRFGAWFVRSVVGFNALLLRSVLAWLAAGRCSWGCDLSIRWKGTAWSSWCKRSSPASRGRSPS